MRTTLFYLLLREPFGIARSTYSRSETFIVNLGGGWGECIPSRFFGEDESEVASKLEEIADLELVDLDSIDTQLAMLEERTRPQKCVMAAIDIALHDRLCRQRGIPLHELLGADSGREMVTSYTIGIDTPEKMLEKVDAASAYSILKIKLGRDMQQDVKLMQLIRRQVGDKRLRVDANCGWTLEQAKMAIRALADLGVEYVEQPLGRNQIEDMRELSATSPLPIYLDEDIVTSADVHRFAGATHGINIKLMKCGGIAEARRMVEVARGYGMKIMVGGRVESSIAVTAAAHLGLLVDSHDLDANLLVSNDPFTGVVADASGRLTLPRSPGLGVSVKPEYAYIFEELQDA